MARGLRNLSFEQDLEGRTKTVEQLTSLSEEYPGVREFSLELAIGLRNLIVKQNLEGCRETVKQLVKLSEEHPGDKDFSLELARGLRNLSFEQDLEGRVEAVKRLTTLLGEYPSDRELSLELAMALHALSYKQDEKICSDAIQQLTSICSSFPNDVDFADTLASTLVNLALAQATEEDVLDTLAKSKALQESYPDCTEIQLSHVMTWFNLTLVQQEDKISNTITEIITFLNAHTDIIPGFKDALDLYLSEHPHHFERYQSFLEL